MDLHLAPRLKQCLANAIRSERYLARLPFSAERRRALQQAVGEDPAHPIGALHRAMSQGADDPANPGAASQAERLKLALASEAGGEASDDPGASGPTATADGEHLRTMPPIARSSMSPKRWPPPLTLTPRLFWPGRQQLSSVPRPLQIEGVVRRSLLSLLTFGQTILATWSMTAILPYHGSRPMEMAILVLFAILFFWISAGFWTAIMGFLLLVFDHDRHAISATAAPDSPLDPTARTAVIMPICNEDVARVFAGLRATYASLAATGRLENFDFFVLSDSNQADLRVGEVEAWLRMCREMNAFGRVFYRWRRIRIKRKSGNVADFCRRWGSQYRYMVVLDADSVMSGECLVRLAQLMDANPHAGIIQTAPRASGRETLHARIQQFATRVYGPLFTAGLHFWQLGESHYWGHNAIIRVQPFTEHCAIGRLTRQGVRNLEILSHDFVEAALMRRAGYGVWIAYDLPGSHEEMPPNLLDELQRDGRWCQGNLINSQLLLAEGVHPA
ncbi:MAG: glucans biosynthesis glucosyltransferase MdoH, partial [Propionivibrio sp.]